MEKIDLPYLCGVIAGLSGIPVRIFDGDERIFFRRWYFCRRIRWRYTGQRYFASKTASDIICRRNFNITALFAAAR